jgi:chromate transporter
MAEAALKPEVMLPTPERLLEVAAVFLKLGLTSFGGPIAHLGYFHEEIVRRRRWLEEGEYADLVALCQFLPGPASSQVAFGLGLRRAGLPGALAASLGFAMPSSVLMILFAYGIMHLGPLGTPGWVQGLKVAAVAVVARAVFTMAKALCPDPIRGSLAVAAAILVLIFGSAWSQITALGFGGLAGSWLFRHEPERWSAMPAPLRFGRSGLIAGFLALGSWAVLLIFLPNILRSHPGSNGLVFARFFRAGSLVLGGGHVVLPMLRAEIVRPGWTTDNLFLAGYGAAQAVPGPLFTFAAYLGTVMKAGPGGWVGGLWALFAIYLPAWLVVGGALPLWSRLRSLKTLRAVMRGANAAVVGVLLAALYQPVWLEGIRSSRHFALALAAFAALYLWKIPAWIVVGAAAGIGAAFL